MRDRFLKLRQYILELFPNSGTLPEDWYCPSIGKVIAAKGSLYNADKKYRNISIELGSIAVNESSKGNDIINFYLKVKFIFKAH